MNLTFPMEPALWAGAITAAVDLAIAFGVPITPDQKIAILGIISPVIALIAAFVVRQNVTPTAKLQS